MDRWWVRRAANWANGSTLLGLVIARAGGACVEDAERGLLLATGYRLGLPRAGAFTVGNVVLSPHERAWLAQRPRLMAHEERHSWQYAVLGPAFLPLYGLAAGYSCLRGGHPATHNAFERLAGLEDGGYPTLRRPARSRPRPA